MVFLLSRLRKSDGPPPSLKKDESKAVSNDSIDMDCPICLCKLPRSTNKKLTVDCCGHTFCCRCIKEIDWCPLCRSFLPHGGHIDGESSNNRRVRKQQCEKQWTQAKRLVGAASSTTTNSYTNGIFRLSTNVTEASLKQGIKLLEEILAQEVQTAVAALESGSRLKKENNNSNKAKKTLQNHGRYKGRRFVIEGGYGAASTSNNSNQNDSSATPKTTTTTTTTVSLTSFSVSLAEIQLTLAKALYNQNTTTSWNRAIQVLNDMIHGDIKQFTTVSNSNHETVDENDHLHSNTPPPSTTTDTPSYRRNKNIKTKKDPKRLAQAHFLVAEIYRKRAIQFDNDDDCLIQDYYDTAVTLDPQNISLLLACAKRLISYSSKKAIQYYHMILRVNKYHTEANLALAEQHYQHIVEVINAVSAARNIIERGQICDGDNDDDDDDETHNNNYCRQHQAVATNNINNLNTTIPYNIWVSYLACIVRAEYNPSTPYEKEQCRIHRQQYIQLQEQQCNTGMKNAMIVTHMDRISAAFIDIAILK